MRALIEEASFARAIGKPAVRRSCSHRGNRWHRSNHRSASLMNQIVHRICKVIAFAVQSSWLYVKWMRDLSSDPQHAFPGHGQMSGFPEGPLATLAEPLHLRLHHLVEISFRARRR